MLWMLLDGVIHHYYVYFNISQSILVTYLLTLVLIVNWINCLPFVRKLTVVYVRCLGYQPGPRACLNLSCQLKVGRPSGPINLYDHQNVTLPIYCQACVPHARPIYIPHQLSFDNIFECASASNFIVMDFQYLLCLLIHSIFTWSFNFYCCNEFLSCSGDSVSCSLCSTTIREE